ncbi:hypothetical protein GCM10010182_01110 [Actinomadura cremea]|nr:hypothetical protein GCM10010182_01110 [Actinomadura cremea]
MMSGLERLHVRFAAAVAIVALAPVPTVHAESPPAALRDVPLPFLWPRAGASIGRRGVGRRLPLQHRLRTRGLARPALERAAAPADDALDGYGWKVRLYKDGNPLVVLDRGTIYGPAPLLRHADGAWQTFTPLSPPGCTTSPSRRADASGRREAPSSPRPCCSPPPDPRRAAVRASGEST